MWVEGFVLGLIQGVTEWLPISSEGMIILAKVHLFGSHESVLAMVHQALFLHMGTFIAALIYFRSDVRRLLRGLFHYSAAEPATRRILIFLFITTLISGLIGLGLLQLLSKAELGAAAGKWVTGGIGLLLIVTGLLQLKSTRGGQKQDADLLPADGLLLGVTQGFAVLPGFSRSGLTVAALLLRGFQKHEALRLSFLMSLPLAAAPLILAGGLPLGGECLVVSLSMLISVVTAAVVGYATIHLLMIWAKAVQFGWFVIGFGLLSILAALI